MTRTASAISPLIQIDRKSAKPLHQQIYRAYRTMILSGVLKPGQQIPSTRALITELKISRIPLLTAYAQLLAEGYFQARQGSGTFVCSSLPDQQLLPEQKVRPPVTPDAGARPVARRAQLLPRYEVMPWFGVGAFSVSQVAYDQFPFQIWSTLVLRHCRQPQASSFHYGSAMGWEPLREAICEYLATARGVHCNPSQVMIVSGSQQLLEISARVLLEPGTAAWMEEPGYSLTRRVLESVGCRLIPVPVDTEGMNVAVGIKRHKSARAAFVAPSHQYPLGVTMSASRRLQLLDWARKSGSWIIEDDYDSEYRYDSMPISSLQGLDQTARVIYIGTFSKVLFPSLRIGYVVIPQDLVEYFVSVRRTMDLTPPYLYQAVLTDFMREGHFARHLRRMRLLYEQRRTALVESLHRQCGRLRVEGAEAGLHLLVTLPEDMPDVAIAVRAAEEKLWLTPLSPYYLEEAIHHGFILGFGGTPIDDIPEAVQKLKAILAARP